MNFMILLMQDSKINIMNVRGKCEPKKLLYIAYFLFIVVIYTLDLSNLEASNSRQPIYSELY